MDESMFDALSQYVSGLFATEDPALREIQAETERNEMPKISLSAEEGRLLQFLVKAVSTRTAVEIGTLAGYSGTWLARALPADGKLYTLEVNPKHAGVARANFDRAGVSSKVELVEGPALDSLQKIAAHGPFDFVFIDANKESYPQYLEWAIQNLRPGGMVTAHNAFRGGRVVRPGSPEDRAMDQFNRAMAQDRRLFSTIISVGDGMAAGVKLA